MSNVMLLYKNVTALSRDEHRNLRLKPVEGFAFAAQTHWLPVAGAEFFQAARSYPIMFVSDNADETDQITPILLVGLELGTNEYVNNAKQWKQDAYLPAFIRRYPFVLAGKPEKGSELAVCFDASFEGLNKNEGRPLFNEDGTNSALLNEALQFMQDFTREMERTRRFVDELVKLDLLEKRSAQIRASDGAVFNVQDFRTISEEKLAALKPATLAALHKEGFLGWIFAHLMSLGNLPGLLELHRKKKAN